MKILIVEDYEVKRTQVVAHLRKLLPSADVIERRSYQSGLKEVLEGEFDVVLLDMSMPTYDKAPGESGGRPRPFAGKDILAQMARRKMNTPVVVVTQFDTFGEGTAKISLLELKNQLKATYPNLYLGSVYYSAAQSDWKGDLEALLRSIKSLKGGK